jgi:FkbM family methyltransferase
LHVEQRTVRTAKFMASYQNSLPEIVIGVLSEYSLPYLHSLGLVQPIDFEVEPGIHMKLDARDLVPRHILANHVYEPRTTKTIEDQLPPGGTFIDVGAHIGFHSLKAARKVGPTGKVVSVEPNPDTLIQLRDNIHRSVAASQVVVQPVACADKESTLELFAANVANTGMSSLSQSTAEMEGSGSRMFKIPARPLDTLLAELKIDRVDAIKIDVEGAEMLVLKGARATLERFHPFIVMEMKEDQLKAMHTSTAELAQFLSSLGYVRGQAFEENVEWIYAPKATLQLR